MPQFSYKARRRTGEVVEGMLDVADRSAALVQIERLGLFPVAVDAAKGAAVAAADRSTGATKINLAALLPPTLRTALARKRKTQAPGAGHLHAAIGQPAQVRHAADRGAATA